MQTYRVAYERLNAAQREAVDQTEGAVLVLAGPGTGKTQLLSTRAAHLLATGSAATQNILCITYTEAGAAEIRSRLESLIGLQGGEIAVHTFHGFGSWLIHQYPEVFQTEKSLQPLDDLNRYQIVESILKKLPLRHPLAVHDEHDRYIRLHAVQEIIRAWKEAGLEPAAVQAMLKSNTAAYQAMQPLLDQLFGSILRANRLPEIAELVHEALDKASPDSLQHGLLLALSEAVATAETAGKTTAIGAWRDTYTRLKDGKRRLKSELDTPILLDCVDIYRKYQAALTKMGRYDYEDMIMWAINALQHNKDMLLDVAERFQYIMVDEYQDTNGAQNALLATILRANPLNDPNVLVVGDDDQAIMRFQGAELPGMMQFITHFEPKIIVLTDNYRSSQPILDAANTVISASPERLISTPIHGVTLTKQLRAHRSTAKVPLTFCEYTQPAHEYTRVSEQIAQLIQEGIEPSDIGVIARKHNTLEAFAPYLAAQNIHMQYDRHAHILEAPQIEQLLRLAEYTVLLAQRPSRAESMLPALLSEQYWQLQPRELYDIAIQARKSDSSWLDTMLAGPEHWQAIAEWLIAASQLTQTQNFTEALDTLLGRSAVPNTKLHYAPYRNVYTNQAPRVYIETLSYLIQLRTVVLQAQPNAQSLHDMLAVCTQYRASGLRLTDNNRLLRGSQNGVQLMTAHGAKGREFAHVFVLSCVEEVWGERARGNTQRIRLPENMPLYPAGDGTADKIRLLYVAMTRAQLALHVSSYRFDAADRPATPLSYLLHTLDNDAWDRSSEQTLPSETQQRTILETAWLPQPLPDSQSLADIVAGSGTEIRISPTTLRDFLDIRYAGPRVAFERHVLNFPSSYNAASALGSAVHKTLQELHAAQSKGITIDIIARFDAYLSASNLSDTELAGVRTHAHDFLPRFVAQFHDMSSITQTELYLTGKLDNIKIAGSVDALITHPDGVTIIDYKTGKPPEQGWESTRLSESKKISLHFYKQQLLFYMLLTQTAPEFKGAAERAELVFVEDTPSGDFKRLTIEQFDANEIAHIRSLIAAVHSHLIHGTLPDTSNYPPTLQGIKTFEQDLLNGLT